MSLSETSLVTNRYKVTKEQDEQLRSLEANYNLPPSFVLRLALSVLLPRVKNEGMTLDEIGERLNKIFNP